MKKIYIIPDNKIVEIELDELIAASPTPEQIDDDEAEVGGGGDDTDITGGGDGFARTGSIWDSQW